MNAGSGGENLILQSIVNTFGNYYGVEKVCLTVDNKPYESGHIVLEKVKNSKWIWKSNRLIGTRASLVSYYLL